MISAVIHAIGSIASYLVPHGAPVFAAQVNWASTNCLIDGVATIQCLVPMFQNVIAALLQLAGIALFIALVVGGYNYLMSGGNPKQMEQAKNTLTYAIIGVVLIVAAYLIILILGNIVGVGNLNKFEIPDAAKTTQPKMQPTQ
jgi:TRAP-type C4-dicarboxylate transport system permease small subunit